MEKVLITGGTGLIGKALIPKLIDLGYDVNILSRSKKEIKNVTVYTWDTNNGFIDEKALQGVDHIIHLAGAGIADKRWTDKRKKEIIDSRVDSANLIFSEINKRNIQLKSFISSSGISYYGAKTSSVIYTEKDEPGNDYLGKLCVDWENAALQFEALKTKVSIIRTGIVLSNNGGALPKMKTPIVSPLASGKQFIPWIHIDDICSIYMEALKGNLKGIYNAAAPNHKTNREFSKQLAKAFKKPFLSISIPRFLLKFILGEMEVLLTEGSRVSSQKLLDDSFNFKFKEVGIAFDDLRKNSNN